MLVDSNMLRGRGAKTSKYRSIYLAEEHYRSGLIQDTTNPMSKHAKQGAIY